MILKSNSQLFRKKKMIWQKTSHLLEMLILKKFKHLLVCLMTSKMWYQKISVNFLTMMISHLLRVDQLKNSIMNLQLFTIITSKVTSELRICSKRMLYPESTTHNKDPSLFTVLRSFTKSHNVS